MNDQRNGVNLLSSSLVKVQQNSPSPQRKQQLDHKRPSMLSVHSSAAHSNHSLLESDHSQLRLPKNENKERGSSPRNQLKTKMAQASKNP